MLGETHRRIAREIAKELNLNEREANLLEVGSVNPDSWADFPHHKGKEYEIAPNILEVRKLYVQNDDECFALLGNALHYIQDRWTLRPRLKDKHTEWEMSINLAPILDDSQLKNEVKRALLPTKAERAYLSFLGKLKNGVVSISDDALKYRWRHEYTFLTLYWDGDTTCLWRNLDQWPKSLKTFGAKVICYALQGRPTTWSTPTLDLNFAYRICLEVARNVFSQENDKEDLYGTKAAEPPRLKRPQLFLIGG